MGLVTLASLSSVHLRGDRCGASTKVATGLSDVSEFARAVKFGLKIVDGLVDCVGNLREGWGVLTVGTLVVTRETATDVNQAHGGKAQFFSGRENLECVIKGSLVGLSVTTTRANVEANANNIDSKLFCNFQKLLGLVGGAAKLVGEPAS